MRLVSTWRGGKLPAIPSESMTLQGRKWRHLTFSGESHATEAMAWHTGNPEDALWWAPAFWDISLGSALFKWKREGGWCVVCGLEDMEWAHSWLDAGGQGQCHLHFSSPTCAGLKWCSGWCLIIWMKLSVDFLLEQVWGVKVGGWWDTTYFLLQVPSMAGLSGLPWPEISDPHSWGLLRTGRSQQGLGDHLLREDILTGSRLARKDQVMSRPLS